MAKSRKPDLGKILSEYAPIFIDNELDHIRQDLAVLEKVWFDGANSQATDDLERLTDAESLRSHLIERYFHLLEQLVALEGSAGEMENSK